MVQQTNKSSTLTTSKTIIDNTNVYTTRAKALSSHQSIHYNASMLLRFRLHLASAPPSEEWASVTIAPLAISSPLAIQLYYCLAFQERPAFLVYNYLLGRQRKGKDRTGL